MLRQQHGIAVRREKNSRCRRRKKPRSGKNSREAEKDLIGLERKCCLDVLIRGLRTSELLKKVLIVAVRSCGCGVLNRGWQNLGASCEGVRVVTFCIVQKVTKKHAGRSPATHDSKLCRK